MSEPSSFEVYRSKRTTPEIMLTIHMVLAARRWRALLDERLRPIGQSSARMEALSAIFNAPEPSSQIDIAKRLRIEGPTMTRMIDSLAEDGLVERRPAPGDRRTKHLALTAAGETVLQAIFEIADPLRKRLLQGIPQREIEQLTRDFAQMLVRLDQGLPDPTGEDT